MIKTLILVPANGKGAINRPEQAYDSLFFCVYKLAYLNALIGFLISRIS